MESASAVIQIGHKQINVEVGKEYSVPKFQSKEGEVIDVPNVLMVKSNENIIYGMPYVGSAKVKIQILGEVKGEKIKSMIYKAKSRYRKRKGFRKVYTKFKVLEISSEK